MDDTFLILKGDGYGLTCKGEAVRLKAALLEEAAPIQECSNAEQAGAIREAIKGLAKFRTTLEASRKAVKDPVLAIAKKIDDGAARFGAECNAEEKRLTKMLQDFAMAEERKRREAAEAARKIAEEEARIAREKLRQVEEEARKQKESATVETSAAIVTANLQLESASETAKAAEQATIFDKPAVKGTKPELDFEIENISELYRVCPALVELTPKRSLILQELKRLAEHGHVVGLPGIRVFEKIKIQTR